MKRFCIDAVCSEVVHLSGQLQDCHISEESLKLEGSSRNDRSLKYGELRTRVQSFTISFNAESFHEMTCNDHTHRRI